MKKLVLLSSLAFICSMASAQEKEGGFKEGFKMMTDSVTENVKEGWDVTKEKTSELSQDAKEGLEKASDSIKNKIDDMHSSYSVSDANTLKKYLTVEVKSAKVIENNQFTVTVLLKNAMNKPVKFDGIMGKTDLIVLNDEGIAHFATNETFTESRALVVPSNAGIKVTWTFKDADSKPITLRLFGVNFPLAAQ